MKTNQHSRLKRMATAALSLLLFLTLLPLNAMAQLGPMYEADEDEVSYFQVNLSNLSDSLWDYAESTPTGTYHFLSNDYITFILRPDGNTSTLPTRLYRDTLEKLRAGAGDNMGSLLTKLPLTEEHRFYHDRTGSGRLQLTMETSLQTSRDGDTLTAHYTRNNEPSTTVKATYRLVKVGNGNYNGADLSGTTWAVRADFDLAYDTNRHTFFPTLGENETGHALVMVTDHIGFAQVHHDKTGPLMLSGGGKESVWQSSDVVPRTSTYWFGHNEAYTRAFGADNQFVAVGNYGPYGATGEGPKGGVDGHWTGDPDDPWFYEGGHYPLEYSYEKRSFKNYFGGGTTLLGVKVSKLKSKQTLTTYNWAVFREGEGKVTRQVNGLWGFRDLYTGQESEIPRDPDFKFDIPEGNQCLGIIKDKAGTITAAPGKNVSDIAKAAGRADNILAVLRGTFAQDAQGNYVFQKGEAALSSSVTATWDQSGEFKVSPRGEFTAKGVSLSCPAFRFYSPKTPDGLSFSATGGKFTINMKPETNGSVLHLDIPGATSELRQATVGLSGSLEFTGEMGISTPILDIADINLSRVGMGYKGSNYTVTGLAASGGVEMPELLGMPSWGVKADIDTFKPNEKYDFSLNLEVPNFFEGEFELNLRRLNNGALVPNKLWMYGNSSAAGIPLIPPVVVAELTGVGGGFDKLADTINGGFFYVPPLRLSFKATAKVLHMLDGDATLTVGAGYYQMKLNDPKFFNLKLGAEFEESLYFTADQRAYNRSIYTGLAIGGSRRLKLSLPSTSTGIILLDTGLALDAFAGLNLAGKEVYLEIDGDGNVTAALAFPKKIGGMSLGKLGGKNIASAKLALALSGKTVVELGKKKPVDIVWSGVKNASGNATLTYETTFLKQKLKIVTVFKKKSLKITFDTWLVDINSSFNWGNSKKGTLLSAGETEDGQYYATYLVSDMEALGASAQLLAVGNDPGDPLEAAGITITSNGADESSYTVLLDEAKAKPDQLLFQLTPHDNMTEDELKSLLTIQKTGESEPLALVFEDYDENGSSSVPNANADVGEDDNGLRSLLVKLPETGEWTISSQNSIAFDIECFGFHLPESLESDGRLSNLRLEEKEYTLRAYLVDGEGDYHLVEEAAVAAGTSLANAFSIPSEDTYENLPTGDYTLVYRLYEKLAAVEENGDPALDENGMQTSYYISLDEQNTGTVIRNVNPNQLPTPTNVTLTAIGSEALRASWEAPASMPDGRSLDGYYVTVYQKLNGEWTATGAGYEVRSENGVLPTSLDMALTIHGEDDEADPQLLTAEQSYRISVSALSDLTVGDLDGDGETDVLPQRSPEAYSPDSGTYLPKATYPVLSYLPRPDVLEDSNMKIINVRYPDAVEVTADEKVTFTVTRMDTEETLCKSRGDDTWCSFAVPDFEGSLIVQIEAEDSEGDRIVDYLALRRDEVPPVLTLDQNSFVAAQDGSFTITGMTEPGSMLTVSPGDVLEYIYDEQSGQWVKNVTVNMEADGRFSIEGQLYEGVAEALFLPKDAAAPTQAVVVAVSASDAAGNAATALAALTATAEIATHTVYFDMMGIGEEPDQQRVTHGESAQMPEQPTAEGYAFGGWYTDVDDTNAFSFSTPITDSMILFAKWTENGVTPPSPNTYTVTFDANGGSVTPTSGTTGTDGKLTSLPTPTRANHTFDGWFTAASGGTKVTTGTVFTADTTIYAHWTYTGGGGGGGGITTQYTLTYNTNGGSAVTATKHNSGTTVNLTATPTREGFTFDGWYSDASLTNKITSIKMDGNKTVYAGWKETGSEHDCPSKHLKDVDVNAWYHEYVDYVVEKGLMQGVAADQFAPNLTTSRAMIVTILHRLEGKPAPNGKASFDDVVAGSWYADAVAWAEENDIVNGYGNGKFGTADPITREQFAAIMYRYANFKGYDVSVGQDTNILSYDDAFDVSGWAMEAMQWAVGSGLISGRTESTLAPKGDATRAEAAAILKRFIENVK
ncbi:MAG: InlB B-repeat-containing protein [Clostridia bacterium]|nr:InlB B-repeat-containing protein [Clostridia bacterium]